MQRDAAKAMALLEATNDYFENVAKQVDAALTQVRQMTTSLTNLYRELVGAEPKPTALEGMMLEAYESSAPMAYLEEIRQLLEEKPFIAESVRNRVQDKNPIFAQPSVLLTYLIASRSAARAQRLWPLTPAEIEPLLNDLGESLN